MFVHESYLPRWNYSFRSVANYNVTSGSLLLEHNYPVRPRPLPCIQVDIHLLGGRVSRHESQVGTWLNVFGYIRQRTVKKKQKQPKQQAKVTRKNKEDGDNDNDLERRRQQNSAHNAKYTVENVVYVEAVMIRSAGALNVAEYEDTLQKSQDIYAQVDSLGSS